MIKTRNPTSFLRDEYQDLVKNQIDWKLRILQGPSTPWCNVDGKKVLMFCSNNYLGLSNHPKLKEAAIKAVQTHGEGSGSVRPFAGTKGIHMELEKKLARFNHASILHGVRLAHAENAAHRHKAVSHRHRGSEAAAKQIPPARRKKNERD